jgi:hypothetical protein
MMKRVLVPPALRPPRRTGRRRGAPPGNANAFKHGKFTRERRALYADIRSYVRKTRALTNELRSFEAAEFSHADAEARRTISSTPRTVLRDNAPTPRASA